MATLDQYDFRKIRRSPSPKSVTKSDIKPAVALQPVVQRTDDDDLKLLKDFDLNYDYGPNVGLSRLERWERANVLGLNPDPEVKKIINQHIGDSQYTESLWYDTLLGNGMDRS